MYTLLQRELNAHNLACYEQELVIPFSKTVLDLKGIFE